jgi:DNA repair protein RadC
MNVMENLMNHHEWSQVAEVELVYKSKVKPSQRPQIQCSNDSYEVLLKTWDINKIELIEQFKILLLNTRQKVLGIHEISTGGISGCVADPRLIFASALKAGATGIILSHNHPSGSLNPSNADIQLTRKIAEGGKLLDIVVSDHLIISLESYYSFADEGMI